MAVGCLVPGGDARIRFLQLVREGLWLPGRCNGGESSCACYDSGQCDSREAIRFHNH